MTTATTITKDRCACHLDCAGCNYGPDNNAWCHNGRAGESLYCLSCEPMNRIADDIRMKQFIRASMAKAWRNDA